MNDGQLHLLGKELRTMRKEAGWSGHRLAVEASVSQPTVSRVENGQRVSDPAGIERMITALAPASEVADRLSQAVRNVYSVRSDRRADAGHSLSVDVARRAVRRAVKVRAFQSAMVPRALRTPEYVKAAGLRETPADPVSADACFVVTEGALRTWPGDGRMMQDQLAHIIAASERPGLVIGVIPWSVPLPVMPPHGFTLYDEHAVAVETFTAELTVTGADEVAAYTAVFARLEAVALTGDAALKMLRSIRDELANIPGFIQ